MKWKPIDTAPKDSSWIMLGISGRNEIMLGYWHNLFQAWWARLAQTVNSSNGSALRTGCHCRSRLVSKPCNCGDPIGHAKAVESAILQSLLNAQSSPDKEQHWRNHADMLERKFTTAHGKHYSLFIYGNLQ